MAKYKQIDERKSQTTQLRKSIMRTCNRSKTVGLLYLLAMVLLTAAVCFPLLTSELAPLGVMEFWKEFKSVDFKTTGGIVTFVNVVLYALMLLVLLINVLKGLGKMGWLFKKKATKTEGFNRSVYAMEDIGRIFGGSLAVIIFTYFVIALLSGDFTVKQKIFGLELPYLPIVLGVGVLFRLALGYWGAKTGYYDLDRNGDITVEKREVGRFAPVVRNLLQFAAVFSIMYFLLIKVNTLDTTVLTLLKKGGASEFVKDTDALISAAAQLLIVLCSFVLVMHAAGMSEYSIDGAHGAGMKNFRVFCFFIFVIAGAAVAYDYFVVDKKLDYFVLAIAGIAFVMWIIELIMRKYPRTPEEKEEIEEEAIEEFTLEQFLAEADAAAEEAAAEAAAQPQPVVLMAYPPQYLGNVQQ